MAVRLAWIVLLSSALAAASAWAQGSDSAEDLLDWLGLSQLLQALPANLEAQLDAAAQEQHLDDQATSNLRARMQTALAAEQIRSELLAALRLSENRAATENAWVVLSGEAAEALRELEVLAGDDGLAALAEYRERLSQQAPARARLERVDELLRLGHRVEFSLIMQLAVAVVSTILLVKRIQGL